MTTDVMTDEKKDEINKLNMFLTTLQTVEDDFIDKLCATDKSALPRCQHSIIDEAKQYITCSKHLLNVLQNVFISGKISTIKLSKGKCVSRKEIVIEQLNGKKIKAYIENRQCTHKVNG